MELHQAFKHIIRSEGQDILTELRLVNILTDLNAYQDIQGSKYIIRAIIEDGYASKFTQLGSLNSQANDLVRRFYSSTGFTLESVEKIFNSIAFGLGWISTMPSSSTPTPVPPTPKPSSPSPAGYSKLNLRSSQLQKKSDSFIQQYKDDAETYLDSIIEIKGNAKNELGIDLKVYSFYDTNDGSLSIHFEISGNFKVKVEYYLSFNAVIYGANGRLIETLSTSVQKSEMKRSFMVKEAAWAQENTIRNVANISRIIVYWELDN